MADGLVKLEALALAAEVVVGHPDAQPTVSANSGTLLPGGVVGKDEGKVDPWEEPKEEEGRLKTPCTSPRFGTPPSGISSGISEGSLNQSLPRRPPHGG